MNSPSTIRAGKNNPPGVVTGLAWTPVGGDILFIEGAFMPGTGKLTLTGQLGDVMKESAKISQRLIRSRLAFNLEEELNLIKRIYTYTYLQEPFLKTDHQQV